MAMNDLVVFEDVDANLALYNARKIDTNLYLLIA